jgi:riboflavin kinase/FMN adenylyltransferase
MTSLIPGYTQWPQSPLAQQHTALAMGIFDGVHLGHQALLQKLHLCAEQEPLATVALTFDPHPAKVLNPAYAPQLLEPIEARVAHMQRLGVDAVVVHPFTKQTAGIHAEAFVRDVLHGIFKVRHIVVGADFVFGHKQSGNVPLLQDMGRTLGFEVHGLPPVRIEGMVASSTKIREFVHRGALRGAQALLGRPYQLWGTFEQGSAATAQPWRRVLPTGEQMPAPGLYAGRIQADGEHQVQALVHVAHVGDDDDAAVTLLAHPVSPHEPLPSSLRYVTLHSRLHAMPLGAATAWRAPSERDLAAAREVLAASATQGT